MTIFPFVITSQLFPLRHILSKWGRVPYLRHILGGMNNWTTLCNNNGSNNRPRVPATLSQAYAHKCLWLTFHNSKENLNKKVIKTGSVLTTAVHIITISCNGKLYYIHSNFTPENSHCYINKQLKKGFKRAYLLPNLASNMIQCN